MIDERERCLELLGLKPGASAQEVKAAYRDMAKVWHPDRFAHDPRLQEKAQNKLKEINEAYEALISGQFKRRAHDAARDASQSNTTYSAPPRPTHNGSKSHWAVLLILVGCLAACVLYISPRLLRRDANDTGQASVAAAVPDADEEAAKDEAASKRQDKKPSDKQLEKQKTAPATASPATSEQPAAPALRPLPTVNVTIDPTTGMLATANCPFKTSMTYPAGREPHQYCTADHRSAAKSDAPPEAKSKSRLKAIVNRIAAPARWLNDKTKESAEQNHSAP